jgi:hypothetical protein
VDEFGSFDLGIPRTGLAGKAALAIFAHSADRDKHFS